MTANILSRRDLESAPSLSHLETALHALLSKKGEDVVVLDLRGLSDVTDFYVIATGGSEPQVETLARTVADDLLAIGHKPHHQEGRDALRWVLLDYFDIVVHVMHAEARDHYRLETLWNDAGRLEVGEDYFADPAVAARNPDLQLVRLAGGADPEAEKETER